MPLEADVELVVTREMPGLDAATEELVARHWARATAEKRLFNGRVFCADTVSSIRLEGHWTEYRRVMAQMCEPALFQRLKVRSVAVCGVLSGPDGVAIGRREARSAYQPGLWQLPPAGSVDEGAATLEGADWRRALLAELAEELGIGAAEVRSLRPLCLVQHPTGVLDLGVHIETGLSAAEIIQFHRGAGDAEYDEMLVVPPDAIPAVVRVRGGAMVPSTPRFLAAYGGGRA